MAQPTQEQKQKIIELIESYFQSRYRHEKGEVIEPFAIGENGQELHGAEEIYNELIKEVPEEPQEEGTLILEGTKMRPARVLMIDPDMPVDETAYDVFELDRDNQLIRYWYTPEGTLKVNKENYNISNPERESYMDKPDKEEKPEQTQAVMRSERLRRNFEFRFGQDKDLQVLDKEGKPFTDSEGKPLTGTDVAIEALDKGERVFLPEGGEGQYRCYLFEDGEFYQSNKLVSAGEDLRYGDFKRFDPDRVWYLDKNGFTSAQDADGKTYNTREEILEKLEEDGARLFLYDQDRTHMAAIQNKDDRLYATETVEIREPNPQDYDMDPGRIPENDRILGWRTDQILYLQDANGSRIEDPEKIRDAIRVSGSRCFIYTKDEPDNPYAIDHREDGSFRVSKWPVDPRDRILGLRADQILYVEDGQGNRIEDPEKIRDAIRVSGSRCLIYMKDGSKDPYVIDHREDGRILISRWPVGAKDREELTDAEFEEVRNNDLNGRYMVNSETLTDADFEEVRDNDLNGRYILNFKRDDIDYAIDEATGKKYETPEEIATALYGTDKTLAFYTKGDEMPYVVAKRNNRFYTSKDRVPKLSQIDDEMFEELGANSVDAKDFLQKRWQFGPSEIDKQVGEIRAMFGLDIVGKEEFAFALDDDGHRYSDLDAVANYLSKNGKRLFIFEKNGEAPFAVQREDGDLKISDDRISSQCRLKGSDEFEPKKSLDVDDIIHRADYTKVSPLKDAVGDWRKMQKFYNKQIDQIKFVKNEGKPKPPKKPEKPSLGFLDSVAYGFVWFFTFGKGDTKAHREYKQDLESYPARVKAYPGLVADYEKRKKRWDEYKETGEAKLSEFRKGLDNANKKLDEANEKYKAALDQYNAELQGNDEADVRRYRNNLEVRLEGAADLQKEGRITRNNIFANTWLKEAECDGKKASDPEAREALRGYIASRAVEEQILKDRVSGDLVNVGVENRRVDDLNSGRAYEALKKDADLNAMLDEMGDGKIDAYNIYNDYTKKLAKRQYEAKGYQAVYTEVGKSMNFTFGKRTIDETCIKDLIYLDRLNYYHNRDRAYPLPYDEKTAKEMHKAARDNIRTMHRDPFTKQELNTISNGVLALYGEGPYELDEMLKKVKEKSRELEQKPVKAESEGAKGLEEMMKKVKEQSTEPQAAEPEYSGPQPQVQK